jgi:protein TonB
MSFANLRGASRASAALAAIAAAVIVGACSKSEPQSVKARPNAPVQVPKASSGPQRGDTTDVDGSLKERLARQEAATRLFEKEPAKAPARTVEKSPPEPKSAPVEARKAAEPARAPEPAKAVVPAPAPVVAPEPAKAEAPAPAPPKVEVAAAKPAAPPAPSPTTAKLVSRIDPQFPREAVQAGVERGTVKARMTLDAGGNVTKVEIVDAQPRRLFDRAVVRALSQWHFSDGPSGRTVETEVEFKLEK